MTNQELHDQESRSSTEIESDIRQTRGRMDATLDELNDRLSARSLLNSALDWWESRGVGSRPVGATKDTYQSVARYVKENPIPSLLVGAGVAWMIIEATTEEDDKRGSRAGRVGLSYEGSTASSSRAELSETQTESGSTSGLVENAKNKLGEAKEAVSGVAGTVKDKVAAVGEAASQTAEELSHRAQNVYQQSSSTALTVGRNLQRGYQSSAAQLENAMEEYPLAVGVGFAAFGALIGVLLPGTRREDELWASIQINWSRRRRQKAKNCFNAAKQSRNASPKARWKKLASRASRQKQWVIKYPNSPEKSER